MTAEAPLSASQCLKSCWSPLLGPWDRLSDFQLHDGNGEPQPLDRLAHMNQPLLITGWTQSMPAHSAASWSCRGMTDTNHLQAQSSDQMAPWAKAKATLSKASGR